ncbi:MAG: hypothetical protein M3O50_04140 [Myxococcota bacterium]|nr:hypothetical protein [Myxococcota bacterium]
MPNRIFFPQSALDQWNLEGAVDLRDGELTIVGGGRRYTLTEAVRVLREVSGRGDERELVGKAKMRTELEQLGAEIVETSMLLGDDAYDIETGWFGLPVGSFAAYVAEAEPHPEVTEAEATPRVVAASDEDLLSRFVRTPASRP